MKNIIHIRDMVCIRCKMAVEAVLRAKNISFRSVELGRVHLTNDLTHKQKQELVEGLQYYHLEIIENKTGILIERIKTEINKLLHRDEPLQLKLSVHLSTVLNHNYNYLANTFSEYEGFTLEKYFIMQRIEKVKELIVYDELSLAEIADDLGYSSVSHLSLQFKKVTGHTPAEFRRLSQTENFVWRKV